MPRRCPLDPAFPLLLAAQDFVVRRDQARAAGLSARAIDYRLSCGDWPALLPGVYLTRSGDPTRRQLLLSAQAYAGPRSAIDAADACRWHGLNLSSPPRGMTSDRAVLAVLSEAVQRRIVTHGDLVRAHIAGPPKGSRAADKALAYIGAGARSAWEADLLRLAAASPLLPTPVCNAPR